MAAKTRRERKRKGEDGVIGVDAKGRWLRAFSSGNPCAVSRKRIAEAPMKFSTFLMLLVVGAAVMIIKSNPSKNLLPFLSREGGGPQQASSGYDTAPRTEAYARFLLNGRLAQHFNDGHILVTGLLFADGGAGQSSGGEFALAGKADAAFLPEGSPIKCDVYPSGTYQFQNRAGAMQTVRAFNAIYSAPGAASVDGNPLNRPAYNRR